MRILNGTGILLHTNLGRARMDSHSSNCAAEVAAVCYDLEFDVTTGKRGDRFHNVAPLIHRLTKAEGAVVVNNNAAAVLLVVKALADGKEVIVSRGELVEIGGSFRIPEVVTSAGGILKLAGASNVTTVEDYEKAITDETALILKIHRSNFRQEGEVVFPPTRELVVLGERYNIPVVEDVGSGSFVDIRQFGLPYEPTVPEVIDAGVALVTFSGDKLLGGPQCGIIAGKKKYTSLLRKNPLLRSLRVGKVIDALLTECLRRYEEGKETSIPFIRMASAGIDELSLRGTNIVSSVSVSGLELEVVDSSAQTGGGACPEYFLPSKALRLSAGLSPQKLSIALLALPVPVVGYIRDESLMIDLRSLLPEDDGDLIDSLNSLTV